MSTYSTPPPPPMNLGGNRNNKHVVGGITSNLGYNKGTDLNNAATRYQANKNQPNNTSAIGRGFFQGSSPMRPKFSFQGPATDDNQPGTKQSAGIQLQNSTMGNSTPNAPGMGAGIGLGRTNAFGIIREHTQNPAPLPPPPPPAPGPQVITNPAPPAGQEIINNPIDGLRPNENPTVTPPLDYNPGNIPNPGTVTGGAGSEGANNNIDKENPQVPVPPTATPPPTTANPSIQAQKLWSVRWRPPTNVKRGSATDIPGSTFFGRIKLSSGHFAPIIKEANGYTRIHPSWKSWMEASGTSKA